MSLENVKSYRRICLFKALKYKVYGEIQKELKLFNFRKNRLKKIEYSLQKKFFASIIIFN